MKIRGVRIFDLGKRSFFGSVIPGANRVCALESHVLEHVGQAGLAHRVLHRAGVHIGEERKDRSGIRTAADDCSQPIG